MLNPNEAANFGNTAEILEGTVRHPLEIFQEVLETIKKRSTTPDYPFGITDLDKITMGLHKKNLTVIGGRPGTGKTSLMTQFAFELATAHKKVLFVSLEMSKEQIIERLFSYSSMIDNQKLRINDLPMDIETRTTSFLKILEGIDLFIVDDAGFNFKSIERLIKSFEPRPDVVFLDFIQMISGKGFESKREAVEEYLRSFKELAITENMAIVVGSQIGRGAMDDKDDRPSLHHLKWSGYIEESADLIIMIWWKKDFNGIEYKLLVDKQRHGPLGEVSVKFIPYYFKFDNLNEKNLSSL